MKEEHHMKHVLLPASAIATSMSYLEEKDLDSLTPPEGQPDLWSRVHSLLVTAVAECAEEQDAKMTYADADGFYQYKGEIDLNRMASKIAWGIGKYLQQQARREERALALRALAET